MHEKYAYALAVIEYKISAPQFSLICV